MKLFSLAFVFAILASAATAELVVINGRYMVAKQDVRGYFYRDRNQLTVFDIRWGEWSTQYRCQDTYDRTRVSAASLNFILQIKDAMSVDFQEFLEGEGFKECRKF